MKGEELLKYQSMQNWFDSLKYCAISRGKTELSDESKKQRLVVMANFVAWSKMNPDELLDEGKRDMNITGKRLIDYFEKRTNIDGLSRSGVVTRIGFLRGFWSHNNLFFPKKWRIPSRIVESKVKETYEQKPMFQKNGNGEVELKFEELQHFIKNLIERDKVISLILLSTGADAVDVLKLNWNFVKNENKRIFWRSTRTKDGIPFRVYLSTEATQFLKRYVKQVEIEQETNKVQGRKYIEINDETPLFFVTDPIHGKYGNRLSVDALQTNFRKSALKMGYAQKGETNPLCPKRFRHLFRNACSYAELSAGWCESMMGHKSSMNDNYLEKPVLMLESEYEKLEPFVTVFGTSNGKVNEMSQEISGLHDENLLLKQGQQGIAKRTEQLETEIENLKAQLKQATEFVYSFEPILDTFSKIMDTPEGQALLEKLSVPDEKQRAEFEAEVKKTKTKEAIK